MDPIAILMKKFSKGPLWIGLLTHPFYEEVQAPEYERQRLKLDGPQEALFNTHIVRFPRAESDWGTVFAFGLYKSPTEPACEQLCSAWLTKEHALFKGDNTSFHPYSIVIEGMLATLLGVRR